MNTIPEPIRGYRTWRVAYSVNSLTAEHIGVLPGLYPKSVQVTPPWNNGVTTALCGNRCRHAAPSREEGCGCGLYGWYQPDHVEPVYVGPYDYGSPAPEIIGVIEGAGRILRYARGFKAEKARIAAIYAADPVQAEMIRATYPDTQLFDDKDDMLATYPAQIEAKPPAPTEVIWAPGYQWGVALANGAIVSSQQLTANAINSYNLAASAFLNPPEPEQPAEETPQEAALRQRKQRNTGPGLGEYRSDGKRKKQR